MPQPVPAPTETQIVIVGEITLLTYAEVLAMVSADDQLIANAKWTRTLLDIDLWARIRTKAANIKSVGSIEFFESQGGVTRLAFRNMMRARYGYDALVTESGGTTLSGVQSLEWF